MIIARSHRGLGPQRRQQGAVAVIVAVSVVVLVLMLGLVLDLGHLYVAKNELQNAADACALSGARALNDLSTGALERATAAAKTAGNRNRVDLQEDLVDIQDADVTFSATLTPTSSFTRAITSTTKYVRCAPHESNPKSIVLWFMVIIGLTHVDLSAVAIASPVAGQSLCAIPLAICTEAPTKKDDDYDFVKGQWYSGRLAAGTAAQGNYEWVRFPGKKGSSDLGEILAGQGMCDVGPDPDRVDAEPGVSTGVAQAWNTRFGLYSGAYPYRDIDLYPPDRSGFAYTRYAYKGPPGSDIAGSWPVPLPPPPENAYDDFVKDNGMRATNAPYNPNALKKRNGDPQNLPGNPSPLSRDLHASKGQDRRLVYVPVIGCEDWLPNKKNIKVLDYACAFMLSPVDDPGTDVQLEFRGLLKQSDCGSIGFPGGSGAPVPALVK